MKTTREGSGNIMIRILEYLDLSDRQYVLDKDLSTRLSIPIEEIQANLRGDAFLRQWGLVEGIDNSYTKETMVRITDVGQRYLKNKQLPQRPPPPETEIHEIIESLDGLASDAQKAKTNGFYAWNEYVKRYRSLLNDSKRIIDVPSDFDILDWEKPDDERGYDRSMQGKLDEIVMKSNQLRKKISVQFGLLRRRPDFENLIKMFKGQTLRSIVLKEPTDERDIQDSVEIMLKLTGYEYTRELQIPYEGGKRLLDFALNLINTALEVKFCNSSTDKNKIIDEMNADIPPYTTRYEKILFVVYDIGGNIVDPVQYGNEIREKNKQVNIFVIKH